jgi:hypothetical protein
VLVDDRADMGGRASPLYTRLLKSASMINVLYRR